MNVNVGVLTVISEVSPEVKLIVTVPGEQNQEQLLFAVYVFPSVSPNVEIDNCDAYSPLC